MVQSLTHDMTNVFTMSTQDRPFFVYIAFFYHYQKFIAHDGIVFIMMSRPQKRHQHLPTSSNHL